MTFGYDTALTAISSARTALRTIGHNLTNANRTGYTRQRVLLDANAPAQIGPGLAIGTGVRVSSIDQIADTYLTARLRSQAQELGRHTVQRDIFGDLETAYGEPDNGLNPLFSGFFGAVDALSTSASDPAQRSGFLQSAKSLAQGFRSLNGNLSEVRRGIQDGIRSDVSNVNRILTQITELNRAIITGGFGGSVPPDIKDQQNVLLKDLAEFVDVNVVTVPTGQLAVSSAGQSLVTPSGNITLEVRASSNPQTPTVIGITGASATFEPQSGRLRGLLDLDPTLAQGNIASIDAMAKSLIRQMNQAHATGVPPAGGYGSMTSARGFADRNGNGSVLDERVSEAGLPFPVKDGTLTVNVRDTATGDVRRTRIRISTNTTTVGDLRNQLDGIDHVSAFVDTQGRLRLAADQGYTFDFSNRTEPHPDVAGTLGGTRATMASSGTFPESILPGDTFSVAVDGGVPQTVTLAPSAFADPSNVGAEELASVVNAQLTGATASVVSGRLVIQSNLGGAPGYTPSITLSDGGSGTAARLGLPTGTTAGSDLAVNLTISGTYGGTSDKTFVVKPLGDGVIGQTAGLKAEVRTKDGRLVGVLDIGQGYAPGSPLALEDGLSVSFGAGRVSAASGQFTEFDGVADGDSSGVLVATGMNALFLGTEAKDIAVNQELLDDPTRLATGLGGGPADNGNILRFGRVRETPDDVFDGASVIERYEALILQSASDTDRSMNTVDTQSALMAELENRRQSISGVNVDEELLNLENYQRAFEVAARYVQALAEVNETLINLVR